MKYSVNFTLEKCRNNTEEGNVRMIIQWSGGGRVSMFVGHRVVVAKWSKDAQRCRPNTMHGKYTAAKINKDIQRHEDAANKVMQAYEQPPSNDEVKQALNTALGKKLPARPEGARDMLQDLTAFVLEQSKVKSWSDNTTHNFLCMLHSLRDWRIGAYPAVSSLDAQNQIVILMQDKGYKSSTIHSYIKMLNWFLRWAARKGYVEQAVSERPSIKIAPTKVIYLTLDELTRVMQAELPSSYARRVRDMFCFCCFTGLRHSDAYALKASNVLDNSISIISKKDTDNLSIELNRHSRGILARVELTDEERRLGYVLPHISSVCCNRELKAIAKECGLDELVSTTSFIGGQKVTQEYEKWQLITTHTARKTFICTALSQGVPPNIIMKWTGHNDYKAMRPYIDIIDEAKRNAMRVFDNIPITEQKSE